MIFESIDDFSGHEAYIGKELYHWAELETSSLRIRERVTEPYVVRGTFHILANARPRPRVHWTSSIPQRPQELLGVVTA